MIESSHLTAEQQELLIEVTNMHSRLHRAGFHEAGQKMHEVVEAIGYEAAKIILQKAGSACGMRIANAVPRTFLGITGRTT